jgi:hypothetical protein
MDYFEGVVPLIASHEAVILVRFFAFHTVWFTNCGLRIARDAGCSVCLPHSTH